jgi:hypothetical protein
MRFFFFPRLKEKLRGCRFLLAEDCRCHKGSRMGPSCKYPSAVFPAAIPTLADLHSGQQQLFGGGVWICVSLCEYLVIWCDRTTVREIIDCSSMFVFKIIYPAWKSPDIKIYGMLPLNQLFHCFSNF